jgi:predicted enzyme related to lactoylglutathione lyase
MIGFVFPESDSEIVIHNDSSMPNPSFSFLVKNVQLFCDEYRKKGCTVVSEPFEVRCGKYAVLADPDRNELPIIDLTKFGGKPKYDKQK